MKKKQNAYFTVEAAFVMPIVLAVTILIMYMMFFRYDRCLMNQDIGKILVQGVAADVKDGEERVKYMNMLATRLDSEKYLAWECIPVDIRQERGKIKIVQTGEVRFVFSGCQLDGISSCWQTTTEYENVLMDPVFVVRSCRKLRAKNIDNQETR